MKVSIMIAVGVVVAATATVRAAHTVTPITQSGNLIHCSGDSFEYTYNPRLEGADTAPMVTGDAGFYVESVDAQASFFCNTSTENSAVVTYMLVADGSRRFGDVSVGFGGAVYGDAGSISLDYRTDSGDWENVTTYASGEQNNTYLLSNLDGTTLDVRFTLTRTSGSLENQVQLFRSLSAEPGQAGDYTFTLSGALVPEPTSVTLLACGMLAMVRRRRRR